MFVSLLVSLALGLGVSSGESIIQKLNNLNQYSEVLSLFILTPGHHLCLVHQPHEEHRGTPQGLPGQLRDSLRPNKQRHELV